VLRIGKLTDYGIDLLALFAAEHSDLNVQGGSAAALSRLSGVPLPTVRKLCKLLSRGGVIIASRGVSGGYRLAKDPRDISIAEVVQILEGPLALTACIADPGSCSIEQVCGTRTNWIKVNKHIFDSLERVTIADMVSPASTKAAAARPLSQSRRSYNAAGTHASANV